MPGAAGESGAAQCLPGGKVRGDRRQFGQRQRLHRPGRLAGRRDHRGRRRAAARLRARARCSSPRPASSASRRRPRRSSARLPEIVPLLSAESVGAGGARDHDDRHLPEGRHRDRRDRRLEVRINGFAKGSGMIAPDMATMLAYIFTDAALPRRRAAAAAVGGEPTLVQLDHGRRRHLDQRHACCSARRSRRGTRR